MTCGLNARLVLLSAVAGILLPSINARADDIILSGGAANESVAPLTNEWIKGRLWGVATNPAAQDVFDLATSVVLGSPRDRDEWSEETEQRIREVIRDFERPDSHISGDVACSSAGCIVSLVSQDRMFAKKTSAVERDLWARVRPLGKARFRSLSAVFPNLSASVYFLFRLPCGP